MKYLDPKHTPFTLKVDMNGLGPSERMCYVVTMDNMMNKNLPISFEIHYYEHILDRNVTTFKVFTFGKDRVEIGAFTMSVATREIVDIAIFNMGIVDVMVTDGIRWFLDVMQKELETPTSIEFGYHAEWYKGEHI